MATAANLDDPGSAGEYKQPDAAGAIEIYRDEIAGKLEHIATIKGDLSDPYKRIKDECHFPRKVLDLLMQLDDMEDAKRQHWLLAFSEGCKTLNIRLETDLVSLAKGEDGGGPIIPTGDRPQMKLVGVDDEDDEFEADAEELAAQQSRPSVEEAQAKADAASEAEPKPGTGAAARKAMKERAAAAAVN